VTAPNLFEPLFDEEFTRYGAPSGVRRARLGYQADAEKLGASLWELPPGCPAVLHAHLGNEEMLMVLEGSPTLRTPAGERDLQRGEVAAFPRGLVGAHAVSNSGGQSVRFLFLSEMRGPEVVLYPESDQLAALEKMSSPEKGGLAAWVSLSEASERHDAEPPAGEDPAAASPNRANLLDPEFDADQERPGFTYRRAKLGRQAGARELGASLYEIPSGEATFPYHAHTANEELLIVLRGRPHLRTGEGWRQLTEGEVVAFRAGVEGAHQLQNRSDGDVRVLVVSTMIAPEVNIYPDSGKVMAATRAPGATGEGFQEAYRREQATDYWEGEEPPSAE
jgi:uncharacterized cupin superfamily protein